MVNWKQASSERMEEEAKAKRERVGEQERPLEW